MEIKNIVLDTCFVRSIIHNFNDDIEVLYYLKSYKDKVKFHIGDVALAELTLALLEDRIHFDDWKHRINLISEILDKDLPVLPGGNELAELAQLENKFYPPEVGGKIFYKESWKLISESKSEKDLAKGSVFNLKNSKQIRIRISKEIAQNVFDDERMKWAKYFRNMQNLLKDSKLSQDEIIELIRLGLDEDAHSSSPLSDKIDAMVCGLGRFVYLSLNNDSPYNPSSISRKGDTFDFSLLQCLSIPAILCTKDQRFKKHIELAKSKQANLVKLPDELLTYLKDNMV